MHLRTFPFPEVRVKQVVYTLTWLSCICSDFHKVSLLNPCEQKLKLQSGETAREERQPASTQSTPSSSPQASPKQKSRGWFTSGSATALPGPGLSTMDSGSGDKDRSSADKWSLFGPRSLPKSESGGFAIQAYKGAQKPSPMEVMRGQATQRTEEPATFKPPKMDIPVMEGTKQLPRAHSLKPRDLNVLTPTGF